MSLKRAILLAGTVAVASLIFVEWAERRDAVVSPVSDQQIADSQSTSGTEREQVATEVQANTDAAAGLPSAEIPPDDRGEPDRARLPIEYHVVFGDPQPGSPLSIVHDQFMNEPRDESWASAMESGIDLALVRSEHTAPIVVEYVECRSSICEVAGFMPDPMQHQDLDPSDLFPDDLGSGWWQGRIDMGTGQHIYDGDAFNRFIVIIADAETFLAADPVESTRLRNLPGPPPRLE